MYLCFMNKTTNRANGTRLTIVLLYTNFSGELYSTNVKQNLTQNYTCVGNLHEKHT